MEGEGTTFIIKLPISEKVVGDVKEKTIEGEHRKAKKSEAKKSGVDLIIQKPFEVEQVLNLVQEGMMLRERFKST